MFDRVLKTPLISQPFFLFVSLTLNILLVICPEATNLRLTTLRKNRSTLIEVLLEVLLIEVLL